MRVQATFVLENTGADAAFPVGFPLSYADELKDFAATVDGVAAASTLEPDRAGRLPSFWRVWPMRFPAGARITLQIAYAVVPRTTQCHVRGSWSQSWVRRVADAPGWDARLATGYVLTSGAPWHGPIGAATVTLRLADSLALEHLRTVSPPPAKIDAGCVTWTFTDVEPTSDIHVDVSPTLPLAAETAAVRRAVAQRGAPEDDVALLLHLVDLHRLASDAASALAAYEEVVDRVAAAQARRLECDWRGLHAVLEATRCFASDEASRVAADARSRRLTKTLALAGRWLPYLRAQTGIDVFAREMVNEARLVEASSLEALGLSARDVVKDLRIASARGCSIEVGPDSVALVALETEDVHITPGHATTTYDAAYRLRGLGTGVATAKLWRDLDHAEAELVRKGDGTFDNLEVTVDGKPVAIGVVEMPPTPNPYAKPWAEHYVGWSFPVTRGAAIDVRVRYIEHAVHVGSGWSWSLDEDAPPEHAGFARHTATWAAVGTCWTRPRTLSVTIELPHGLGREHVRRLTPSAATVDGSRIAWRDVADTSQLVGYTEAIWTSATWKTFDRAEEIAWLSELLTRPAPWTDLCRLHLAYAYRALGRADDEVRVLEAMVAGGARPVAPGAGRENYREPGMYALRPVEAYLADALRRRGDPARTAEAARHAITALRRAIAENPPDRARLALCADLVYWARYAGDDAAVREGETAFAKPR